MTKFFPAILLALFLFLSCPPAAQGAERPAGSGKIELSASETAWLKEHPVIRLAPDPEFAPIEFFDRKGEYQGVAADMIRLLEAKLGFTFTIVKAKDWDEVMAKFKAHQLDALGAIVPTPNRRTFIRISQPLLQVPGAILVRNTVDTDLDLDKLKGLKVAVVSNYTAHDIMQREYPEIQLDIVKTTTAGLTKVSFGMVDAFVENLATATYYTEEAAIGNVRVAGDTPFLYQWGIGVRQDWPELEGIINKGIEAITQGERHEILNRWIAGHLHPAKISRKQFITLGGVAAVLLSLGVLIWNIALRRRVAARTEALKQKILEQQAAEDEIRVLNANLEQRVEDRTRELRNSREQLQSLMDISPIAIVYADLAGTIQYCNRKFQDLFGYTLQDIPTINAWYNLAYPDEHYREGLVATWQKKVDEAIRTGKEIAPQEAIVTCKDGSVRHVSAVGALKHSLLIAIFNDLTDRIKEEAQRVALEERLQQAQKMEAIGNLAGGIAHDFNNILSAIFGYAELAKCDLDDRTKVANDLEEILNGANRARDLVKQILAFSRKSVVELQPIKLQFIVKEVLKLLRSTLPATIGIEQEIDRDCPPVMADPTQIHQVIMNLCTNAYHAMREINGTLRVSLQSADVGPDAHPGSNSIPPGQYAILEVSDTGSGISKEVLEKIFEPYFTTKEKTEGTGLGLAVVHGIVQSLGGHIEVESELGRGSTFRIFLKAIESAAQEDRSRACEPLPRGNEKILFVDDDGAIVGLQKQTLENLGYQVTAFTDSIDAFEAFTSAPDGFDLLITDMTMPKMTGDVLSRQVLAIRPGLPIIMCTGFSERIDQEMAKNAGIREFLLKPLARKEVATAVRKALDTQAG